MGPYYLFIYLFSKWAEKYLVMLIRNKEGPFVFIRSTLFGWTAAEL